MCCLLDASSIWISSQNAHLLKNIRAIEYLAEFVLMLPTVKAVCGVLFDCKYFVPEVEQLPYFKEQVIAWAEKA